MCQRKKLQIKFNKKQQFRVATLLDADKIITFSKERQVAKYIMKHGKIAGQQTLEAGLPITILKGNQIVRREPDGKEMVIASVLKEEGFVPVSQAEYTLK